MSTWSAIASITSHTSHVSASIGGNAAAVLLVPSADRGAGLPIAAARFAEAAKRSRGEADASGPAAGNLPYRASARATSFFGSTRCAHA